MPVPGTRSAAQEKMQTFSTLRPTLSMSLPCDPAVLSSATGTLPIPKAPKVACAEPQPLPTSRTCPSREPQTASSWTGWEQVPKLQLNPPGTGLHFPHTLQREKPLPSGHPSDNRKYFSPAPRSRGCPGRPLGTPGTSRRAPEGDGSLPAPGSTAPGMKLPAPACKSPAPLPSLCG